LGCHADAINVSVFGGSQPKPGSLPYEQAYEIGKLIAEAGHTILMGGYIREMEVVGRGAAEANGHVIGVTCAEIECWRKSKANAWAKEERRCETLLERLKTLINSCDAAAALPGGPGTLTEIALTWNLTIVGARRPIPLVLVGDGWRQVIDQVFESFGEYTPKGQRELLLFAPNAQVAVRMLETPG
jgi:hypothetical protein